MFREKEIDMRQKKCIDGNYDELAQKIRFDPQFNILGDGVDIMGNERLNEAIKRENFKFKQHMSSNEIFVAANNKIQQVNPILKFDLIQDNFSSSKMKQSKALSKLKGRTKSDVNMIYLPNRKFLAELNSHLIDRSFKRNRQIDVSEALSKESYYGDVYKADLEQRATKLHRSDTQKDRMRVASDELDKFDEKQICDLDEEIAEMRRQLKTHQFQLVQNAQPEKKTAFQKQ